MAGIPPRTLACCRKAAVGIAPIVDAAVVELVTVELDGTFDGLVGVLDEDEVPEGTDVVVKGGGGGGGGGPTRIPFSV